MKFKMILTTVYFVFLINYINAQEMADPMQGLRDFANRLDAGARAFIQDLSDKFKPLVKNLRRVNKNMFGGLDNAVFNAQKGIVEGLDEVFGIPANIDDVEFYLATSKTMDNPIRIDYNDPSQVATNGEKIFFVIHGWMSSKNTSWYPRLTEILLRKFPLAHVVLINWEKPAADSYPFSAFKTESVGNIVGDFIYRLISEFNVPIGKITMIGHSLGGQISGWVGKRVKALSSEKLPRIIALDPAGPLFTRRPDSRRLNKHDAHVVMVIHSDGGKLGFPFSCGTIDFYPNGGINQPGCAKVDPLDIKTIFDPLSCNHYRAYEYFMEALNNSGTFRARKCASYTLFTLNKQCQDIEANLGNLDENAKGSFYLETAAASPYALPLKPLFGFIDVTNAAEITEISDGRTVNTDGAQDEVLIIDIEDGSNMNSMRSTDRMMEVGRGESNPSEVRVYEVGEVAGNQDLQNSGQTSNVIIEV